MLEQCLISFLLVFRGKKQYEPPRFMAISVAIEQLLEVELKRGENGKLNVIVALHVGFFLLWRSFHFQSSIS